MDVNSHLFVLNSGGEHGDDAQRESAETEVQTETTLFIFQRFKTKTINHSPVSLSPSASSLIPVPPVSQWHDHASVVSISTPTCFTAWLLF